MVVRVTDRTCNEMRDGVRFTKWPEVIPKLGERVVIFDCNLDFSRHDVVYVKNQEVKVGPAIPFERR